MPRLTQLRFSSWRRNYNFGASRLHKSSKLIYMYSLLFIDPARSLLLYIPSMYSMETLKVPWCCRAWGWQIILRMFIAEMIANR